MINKHSSNRIVKIVFPIALLLIGALASFVTFSRAAGNNPQEPQPLHPTFALLDAAGINVLESEAPVSAMETCGQCHDSEFVAEHSGHANLGFGNIENANFEKDHEWDISDGYFGDWNALEYRYLSSVEDDVIDLTTSEWIAEFGARVVGGNPGQVSRDGSTLLQELRPNANNPEAAILNAESNQLDAWDWQASGDLEMNCFLCHLDGSNNQARIDALQAGDFAWANTATLEGSGIVALVNDEWQWQASAFQEDGQLARDFIRVQDPSNENCGQCHGLVHEDPEELLTLSECSSAEWESFTVGTIFSPQRISNSGMNISGKDDLDRSWDIHAERLVQCVDCHFSLNNPVFLEKDLESNPEHLIFDPRRLDFGDYLYQPLHQFARTDSAQASITNERISTIQACESCHDPDPSHTWLPYPERHIDALSCESCHIPQVYAPSIRQNDWTVLSPEGQAMSDCRGVEDGTFNGVTDLITPYEPALIQQNRPGANPALGTFNLVASWYWVYDDPPKPVRLSDLQRVWLEEGSYPPEIIAAFDQNGNEQIENEELAISNAEQEELIRARLAALGLASPRIVGEIQPFAINHSVTGADYAIRDCQTCHSDDSRLAQSITLANYVPGNVMPEFLPNDMLSQNGDIYIAEDGQLKFQADFSEDGLYILGHDKVLWVDWFGAILFVGTLLGATIHGGIRVMLARKTNKQVGKRERIYMYGVYERLWHWLQSFTILALALTGLIIHKPAMFAFMSFRGVVLVHNILAAILIVNAFLALFYHLASGEIRQYIPQPRGFFSQMVEQGLYYLRGIFKGEDHPFEKTLQKKLNPLQQIVYFGLLNVLLPLQILTGAVMWGAQQWPQIADRLGGLPFLGPFHTLIAWSLSTFIVMHIYLTTTAGDRATDGIRSMIFGWEDVDVHEKK